MKYSLFYEGNINSSYAFVITFFIQQLLVGRFKPCFFTCSSAFLMNFFLSLVNSSARSARSGCSGSGSCTRATSDCITETQVRNVQTVSIVPFALEFEDRIGKGGGGD